MKCYRLLLFLSADECTYFSAPATVVFMIALTFEALLFSLFTAIMFGTQIHAICTDETVSDSIINQLNGSI